MGCWVFVKAQSGEFRPLGIGKLVDANGGICAVEYFDAPTSDPIVHYISRDQLARHVLPGQTRMYYFNAPIGVWEIGRLFDDHGTSHLVRFPQGVDRILPVEDLFVRWSCPIGDPTPFLGSRITETPRFSKSRQRFVRSLITQRAASMGMSALGSSAIELEAHQVEVVRRVLQDPVQRYLLADEVGLGKTVEAGILIRQCFLDCGDDATVVVIVPDALVAQWKSELTTKFFLGHLVGASLHVISLNSIALVNELLDRAVMLVIDEAHHLTDAHATDSSHLYSEIAAAAPKIERVFLLSATPALNNERGFLKMLHLLDPFNYRLNDEAGFRRRIEGRHALAQIVASLTPDNSLFLDDPLDKLVTLFPEDKLLQEHVAALRSVVVEMPDENDPDLIASIGALRAHVAEIYRLHRRILRHRRRSVGGLTPDRSGATIIEYSSQDVARISNAFEDLRFEENNVARAGDRHSREEALYQILGRFLQYARVDGLSQPNLAEEASWIAILNAELSKLLDTIDTFGPRTEALSEALRPLLNGDNQFVVFCSDRRTADLLAAELSERLGVASVRYQAGEHTDLIIVNGKRPRILVCDRDAEEGLNLQGKNVFVAHYDIPLNANRIEQRLGRVDRYGSGRSIRSIVVSCLDNPIERAWLEYLNVVLGVFDRSVASLQYVIDDITDDLKSKLFSEGPEAFLDLTKEGEGQNGTIEREIRAIDQQDALDSLGTPPENLLDALGDVDESWENIEQDAAAWIENSLLFERKPEGVQFDPVTVGLPFRYRYSTSNSHTLITLESFYDNCKSAVDRASISTRNRVVQTVPLTYRRRTAISRQGREINCRLLRYGDPFITGMWSIADTDDRGRSTAMWRYFPGYKADGAADIFFQFEYIVETDISHSMTVLQRLGRSTESAVAAMRRRGDMAFPPIVKTIWLDRELQPVFDEAVVSKLDLGYRTEAGPNGGRDFNVDNKRWRQLAKLEIPEIAHWMDLCKEARITSENCLRSLPSFAQALNSAHNRVREAELGRLAQLRARAQHTLETDDMQEWEIERELSEALVLGVREPTVRLDTIHACFISGDMKVLPLLTRQP